MSITPEQSRSAALATHADAGGYLVRSGESDLWIVCDDLAMISGFRDLDAYGPNLSTVTEDEWEHAA